MQPSHGWGRAWGRRRAHALLALIGAAAIGACLVGCDRSNRTQPLDLPPPVDEAEAIREFVVGISEEELERRFRARLVGSTLPPPPPPPARGRQGPPPVTSVRAFELVNPVGGTHHTTLIHDSSWIQSFGTTLMVLDDRTGRMIGSLEVAPRGTAGPIVDMLIADGALIAVLERDAVAEVTIGSGGLPVVRAIRFADELGVTPRRVARIGDDTWIYGEGGIVRWPDGRRPPNGDGIIVGVASCGGRLALARNRRVIWADEGVSRHAATTMRELPPETGAAAITVMQSGEAARLALLDGALEELHADVVEGLVRRVRHRDGRVWAITDETIVHWSVRDGRFGDRQSIRVRGARDVAVAGPNRLAIAGSFGRSFYRPGPERGNPGDEFYNATREPSRLSTAVTDGRRVLAGSPEGRWLYLIGGKAELSDRPLESRTPPAPPPVTRWGPVRVSTDRRELVFEEAERRLPTHDGGLISTLALIDGDLWVGHEFGVDLVGADADGAPRIEARLRLDGPVIAILQKWDAGGVIVSEYDGFAVARLVETDLEPLGLMPSPPNPPAERGGRP